MCKPIFAALSLAMALAAGGGHAAERSGAWQVGNHSYHLYLADLDMKTAAGRATALARVETIARRLCRGAGVRSEERACQAKVVNGASGSLKSVIEQALAERGRANAAELAAGR